MPCDHKFIQHLSLRDLGFEPQTLIVGSFIPAWPATDTPWFYGQPGNYFWDILPRLCGEPSLLTATQADWQQFCHRHHIALTDLIEQIEDADQGNKSHNAILAGSADKAIAYNFDDFVFVDIVALLRRHPSIKNVYITRGVTEAFWRHLWNPVMHYCSVNGLHQRVLLSPAANQHGAHIDSTLHTTAPQDAILTKWQHEWHY